MRTAETGIAGSRSVGREEWPTLRPTPGGKINSYRCPGCGKVVEGGNAQEMLLHHQHVLHPERYNFPSVRLAY